MSMLQKFGLAEAKTVSTPANLSVKLRKDDETSKLTDIALHQSIVGSLLYTAIGPIYHKQWEQHPNIVHAPAKYI